MMPNPIAILAAAVAAFAIGAIWYGVLGKKWMAAQGCTEAEMAKRTVPVGPMIASFVAELIMAVVLSGLIRHIMGGSASMIGGAITGTGSWLAFVVTTIAVNNAYQKRRVMLTVIDSGHWLAVLVVEGLVLGAFG